MKRTLSLRVAQSALPLLQQHVATLATLFATHIVLNQTENVSEICLFARSDFNLIQAKHYVESLCSLDTKPDCSLQQEEKLLSLSPAVYQTLTKSRTEIMSVAPAEILWDNESSRLVLSGSREAVHQTAFILGQIVAGSRKLMSRGGIGSGANNAATSDRKPQRRSNRSHKHSMLSSTKEEDTCLPQVKQDSDEDMDKKPHDAKEEKVIKISSLSACTKAESAGGSSGGENHPLDSSPKALPPDSSLLSQRIDAITAHHLLNSSPLPPELTLASAVDNRGSASMSAIDNGQADLTSESAGNQTVATFGQSAALPNSTAAQLPRNSLTISDSLAGPGFKNHSISNGNKMGPGGGYNKKEHHLLGRTVSDGQVLIAMRNHKNLSRGGTAVSPRLSVISRHEQDASSDGAVKARRKLEPEDSSYDSDHEFVGQTQSLSISSNDAAAIKSSLFDRNCRVAFGDEDVDDSRSLSSSHDDISRSFSETLGQEFSEYVSTGCLPVLRAGTTGGYDARLSAIKAASNSSRETSPSSFAGGVGFAKAPVVAKRSGSSCGSVDQRDMASVLLDPVYNAKVEFALKLGYAETLTQRALQKIGVDAAENDLLVELIRLQKINPGGESKEVESNTETVAARPPVGLSTSLDPSLLLTNYNDSDNLRPIVIDGSNVAMSHGNKEKFSCLGIKICIQWFQTKGHKEITAFVPNWRKESSKPDNPTSGHHILEELEKEGVLSYTPSRQVGGKRVVCHDDRYILNLAAETDAVVVSNDNFRELINEKPEFKKVIEERILMYSFVNDRFMPPDDPLGRNGPTLDAFLRKTQPPSELPPPCPYDKKCTYGNKCKFYHAERGSAPHKSVTDKLKEQSKGKIQEVRTRGGGLTNLVASSASRDTSPHYLHRTESDVSVLNNKRQQQTKAPLSRTKSSRNASSVCLPPTTIPPPSHQFPPKHEMVSKSKSTDPHHSVGLGHHHMYQHHVQHGHVMQRHKSRGGSGHHSAGGPPPGHPPPFHHQSGERTHSLVSGPPPTGVAPPWPFMAGGGPNGPVASTGAPQTSTAPSSLLMTTASTSAPLPGEANYHRPLQRQLTINPNYDPRINNNKPGGGIGKAGCASANGNDSFNAIFEHIHRPPPPLGMPPSASNRLPSRGALPPPPHHTMLSSAVSSGNTLMQQQQRSDRYSPLSYSPPLSSQQHVPMHTVVTRISSAPDSINQWGGGNGSGVLQPPKFLPDDHLSSPPPCIASQQSQLNQHLTHDLPAVLEPLELDLLEIVPSVTASSSCGSSHRFMSTMSSPAINQLHLTSPGGGGRDTQMLLENSSADSQIYRRVSETAASAEQPLTGGGFGCPVVSGTLTSPAAGAQSDDTIWKYFDGGDAISPLFLGSLGLTSSPSKSAMDGAANSDPAKNIWCHPPASVVKLETPPPSPTKSNLGPVGSRPSAAQQQTASDANSDNRDQSVNDAKREEVKYHLRALFPSEQVDAVMSLMPDETNPKTLCATIMEIFPNN